MSIVNYFRNKILSAQRNVLFMEILGRVLPKKCFFCLCVENVMHVLHPFFFITSHGVGRFFTYKVSVVISGQIAFALKIALKSYLRKVSEI